jgi:hypothetical protein
MSVDTESDRTIEAAVSADLAVHAMIDDTHPPHLNRSTMTAALPPLPAQMINLYRGHARLEVHRPCHAFCVTLFRKRAHNLLLRVV